MRVNCEIDFLDRKLVLACDDDFMQDFSGVRANDVSAEKGVMGGDKNTVHLVSASGVESWPELSKQEVAQRLMAELARRLGAKS